MALPTNNASFQKGDFSGFTHKGLCRVVPRFDAGFDGLPGVMERASGEHFAVLDGCGLNGALDQWGIGPDGARQYRDPKPADMFDKVRVRYGNGDIVSGFGSWLRCSLDLPIGGRIRFVWAFATTTRRTPFNTCLAGFRFLPTNSEPVPDRDHFVVAPSTADVVRVTDHLVILEQMRWANDPMPAWRETEVQWAGHAPFKGQVEWLVCSAHFVDTDNDEPNRAKAACYPACLMLDHIRLT